MGYKAHLIFPEDVDSEANEPEWAKTRMRSEVFRKVVFGEELTNNMKTISCIS